MAALLAVACLPTAASGWDGKQELTSAGPFPFALAGNEHGRRAIAWADNSGVFVSIARRGRRFGPTRRVAGPPRKGQAQVAVDERGNVAIDWTYDTQEDPGTDLFGDDSCCWRLMGAVLRSDGRVVHRTQLGLPGDEDSVAARLTSDGEGHLGLAFVGRRIYARFGTMARGFGPLHAMSPQSDVSAPISAASGRVIYSTNSDPRRTIETQIVQRQLVKRVLLRFPIEPGQLDSDDHGRQTVLWGAGRTATRRPPGPFPMRGGSSSGYAPAIDVAGSGAAVGAWQVNLSGGPRSAGETRVYARVRRPRSGFSSPLELDRFDIDSIATPSVDAAPGGASAVGVVGRGSGGQDHAYVYLVGASGRTRKRLVAPSSTTVGEVKVLRDARGTLAVTSTRSGLVARWVR